MKSGELTYDVDDIFFFGGGGVVRCLDFLKALFGVIKLL